MSEGRTCYGLFLFVLCMSPSELSQLLGRIDIYLLDQLLKGNIDLDQPILDAGCGGGRNVIYFMRKQLEVYGVDFSSEAIEGIQALAKVLGYIHPDRFSVGTIQNLPHPDAFFGTVICNAVLHFSESEAHFRQAIQECWRVLKQEGVLFVRTAVSDGVIKDINPISGEDSWYELPDGTTRFLVSMKELKRIGTELGGSLVQPIRAVMLPDMRSMCTWCLQKKG